MAKKGLKGFANLRVFPVTTNNDTTYAVGEKVLIPSVVSGTTDLSVQDYTLYADDGIYDSGSDFQSATLEVVVQELPLELHATLDGAEYDEETGVYAWGPGVVSPELALGFSALMRNGGYLMVQYYSVKATSIKVDYATKGSNQEGSPYTITFQASTRMADNTLYRKKEAENAAGLTWLDTVDTLPVSGG